MIFEITDEELKKVFENDIKKTMKQTLKDGHFDYWVRNKVYELLAEKIIEDAIKKHFTENEIRSILKEAIKRHLDDKYDV